MSPVRADAFNQGYMDSMLRTINPPSTNKIKNSERMDFKEYLEKELYMPKAAALKKTSH